jgi:prepilin-type N-terminal cleavage/methylation domain-containing protein
MIKRLRSLRLRGDRGYSLIEMLVVMVIMSIVFAGVTAVFVAGSKAQADQDRRFQAQLTTRIALDKIRRDIHCANDVTPYATNSVTLKISGCTGGDISWCTVAVSGYTDRFALYRKAGTTCAASGGTMIADYLTTADAFPAFTHTTGSLAALQVDFTVSVKRSATVDTYDLGDTIFLRNSLRA